MKNVLYFILLITAFSIFAVEESERAPKKENNIDELQSQVDTIETKQGSEQNLPEQIKNSTVDNQVQNAEKDKEADYISSYDFILDKWPALKALDEEDKSIDGTYDEKHHFFTKDEMIGEKTHSNIEVEKVINQDDEINEAPEEYNRPTEDKLKALNKEDKRTDGTYDEEHKVSKIEETSNQNNKATKEFEGYSEDKISDLNILNKNNNGIFSHSNKNQLSTEVTESVQDNKNLVEGDFSFDNMKNDKEYSLQIDSKPEGINKSEFLDNRENVEITNQAGEKKEGITESKFNKQRQEKYIVKRGEDESKDEKKKQQNLTSKKPITEWIHKSMPSRLIYKRQYDTLNEHLPTTVFINDYSKQLFYCIKKNNLPCLRGVLSKLEKTGLSIDEVLKWRNKLRDTSLIYASKCGNIDIVRFLLLQNSDSRAVNYNFQSAMDVAIEGKQIDIINAIAEMVPRLIEHKTIDNEKDSIMYNWAIKTKDLNKSKYDAAN